MNDYIALRLNIHPCNEDNTDLLASFLADAGYESFEPDASGLTAYILAEDFDNDKVKEILEDFPIKIDTESSWELVPGQDWNHEWEKNYFMPIVIDEECVIHSTFHKDIPKAKYDIVIDPKMAFGTGHHATTSMMLRHLLNMDLRGKRVMDMGTGTGILAILASMAGAVEIVGVEIDPAAYANALENAEQNGQKIIFIKGDSSALSEIGDFDIFLANINRNVILADLDRYSASIRKGGELILSGFYESDTPLLKNAASLCNLEWEETVTMDDPNVDCNDPAKQHGKWASLRFKKI